MPSSSKYTPEEKFLLDDLKQYKDKMRRIEKEYIILQLKVNDVLQQLGPKYRGRV